MKARLGSGRAKSWLLALVLGLAALLAYTVANPGDTTILLLVAAALATLILIARPGLATLFVVFLLYTNIPVVATQFHGVPRVVAGAFTLLLGIPLAHHVIARREGLRWDRVLLLFLLYAGVLVTGAMVAKDVGIALGRITVFLTEGLLLYWLLLNCVRSVASIQRVIFACLAGGALLGSLSLFQATTGNYDQQFEGLAQRQLKFQFKEDRDLPDGGGRMYKSDRAEGPLGEPNRYAQIMVVLLPLGWFAVRGARRPRRRLLLMAATGAILAGMLLSYSRGGFVGLVVMSVAAAGFGWIRPRVLVIAGITALVAAPILAPSIVKRLVSMGELATALTEGTSAQQVDGSIRGRLTETLAAAQVFFDHPIIGVGPGQYAPFYSEEYQKNPTIKFRDILKPRRAHNLYSELAAEGGILGLGIFLSIALFLVHGLWVARRRWLKSRPEYADLATAFLLAFVGYFVTAVFLHLSYERYYWFLTALAGATIYVLDREWRLQCQHAPHLADPVPFDRMALDGVPAPW